MTDRMQILHFCETLRGGGIAALVSSLAGQNASRHRVTICCIFQTDPSESISQGVDPRVEVISLQKAEAGFSIKYPFRIYWLLRKGSWNIVNIHGSFLYYAFAILLLHRKINFFYTVHSDARKENGYKWDKYFFWLKKLCFKKGYIRPVTISGRSKQSFDELYGLKSHLIYNGANRPTALTPSKLVGRYRYTPSTKMLFHAGRITEAKNQLVLCSVCERLISEGYDIVLLIAGGRQDESIYRQMLPFFSDRIVYIGEKHDILEIMHSADAMCLPSIWEGMPITLLEAFATGTIPVCTPVGGITDAIAHMDNGILATDCSEESFYEALRSFLALPPQRRAAMQKNALATFEKYDIHNTALQYEKYYSSTL